MSGRVRYLFASLELANGWAPRPENAGPTWMGVPLERAADELSFVSFIVPSPRGEGRFEVDPIRAALDAPIGVSKLRDHVDGALSCYDSRISKPFDCVEWEIGDLAGYAYTIVRRTLERGLLVQRQWHLSRGTDMIVAAYTNQNGLDVAPDLMECNEMARTIRFER